MKITGFVFACLSLAGCTVLAGSGDFEVVDGGPGGTDAQPDTRDGGPDTGPEPDCTVDEDCNATNASATCDGAEGVCVLSCDVGFADCDMSFDTGCEVDTTTSVDHCGGCGVVCDFDQASETCEAGACEFGLCQEGWGDCNNNATLDGCEARLTTPTACGGCGVECDVATPLCDMQGDAYVCVPDCVAPEVECEGSCVDFATDPLNCGSCGAEDCARASFATPTCEMNMCSFECEAGRGDCNLPADADGCESDTMASLDHCGGCDIACAGMNALWTCDAGACAVDQCDPAGQFENCDADAATGCEVDLMNDALNCGVCGATCDGVCENGYCDPIENVTGQDEHICIRRRSGKMMCWGLNLGGQLGDGTFTARPLPTLVVDPESMGAPLLVRDISAGQRSTCAIDMAGEIWCWGSSAGGITGAPSTPTAEPRLLAGDPAFTARTFTQIAAGHRSACALDDERHVWCWGDNGLAQLGSGTSGDVALQPVRVAGLDLSPLDDEVAQLVYGRLHGCIRLVDGAVRCWGRNDEGQAGIGAGGLADRAWDVGLSGITDIAAGDDHTCAVNAMGAMWCWGFNDNGQFGNGVVSVELAPVAISVAGAVSNLSAGLKHTCATVGGQPRCWGRGDEGELGTGDLNDARTPVAPLDVSAAATLIAVHGYTCAIDEGRLSCWGSNARGQLAREATIIRTTPTPLPALGTTTTAISVEGTHSCAVSGGGVYCWGTDPGGFGRLGGAPAGATPTRIRAATSVRAVVQGTAINTSGSTAFGFGFNNAGRIEAGTGAREVPTAMTFVGPVNDVGMGTSYACALQGTAVNCRGFDGDGQLGRGIIGGGVDDGPALPVVGLAAAQLSVSATYACAIQVDDQVVCWGDNQNGQLGNNTMVDSATPLAIPELSDAIMVATGRDHACGIQRAAPVATSGQVWCWGRNVERQTGGMAQGQRVAPNVVFGLDDAVSVQAYTSHSCAIRSGGQVVCWGSNRNYELGDGTIIASTNPVDVVGLADAAELATGGIGVLNTCAVRTDGSAVCWGGCWDGLCGTGESLTRSSGLVQGLDL